TLTGVDVENNGTLQVDASAIAATLVIGTGSSIDGDVNVGASGELDISGGTFNGAVTIYDQGIFDINTALTLDDDVTIVLEAGGSFVDTGTLTVADHASITLSGVGADFGTLDIGNDSILTLDSANASVVDFTGTDGTLVLKEPSGFTGTIEGLTAGDVIDLAGVSANTVSLDGTKLLINGVATSFSISGLPTGDVFAFKSDGNGGTDLKVAPQALTITASPVSVTEGSAIELNLSETLTNGATLTSVTISGIPADAKLTDAHGDTLTATGGSITLTVSQLAGLSVAPGDDTNFTLSLTAIATDSDGYQYLATTTEAVTVSPLAPSVSWAAGTQVDDASLSAVPIALNRGVGAEAADGTHNSITSVIISGIEIGAVISDGTHTFTASQGHTSLDVTTGWDLSKLTIIPGNSANFTLTATVIESDSDGQTSSASADLKVVTGTDWTHAGTLDNGANWQTAADWDEGVPNSALNAVFDSSVTTPAAPYSVTISPYATAEAHALTFNDANAILYDRGHLLVDSAATIDAGWIGVESADFDGAANAAATMTVGGPLTIHGGEIAVMGGVYFGTGSWPGGTLDVTGAIVVDGGKLVIEPGTNTNLPGAFANPGGTLNAGSINVETGGSVELHGVANVSGLIETTGGNLIIGSDTQFTGTHTITFGSSNGGTVSFVDTTTQTYSAPDISGFGAGGATTPDVIDLVNFDLTKTTFAESISNGNLVLTATEGGATTTLTFDNYGGGLHFATDGSVGTDITASAQPSPFTVLQVSGVEGSAIALNIQPTVNGATPTSITISGIPSDAVLANNGGTLTVTNGSITLTAAQLAGLTITPGDAGDINLSLLAIVADSQGYHTAIASEAVTVSPLPPSVSWVAGSQVVDGAGAAALI